MIDVFEAAKNFHKAWADMGKSVGEIDFSTNRFGQKSAYFDVAGHGRFRVSDHSCNTDFRINERTVDVNSATKAEAERIATLDAVAAKAAKQDRAGKLADRDAYEAPFKARFLSAKEHERAEIVIEAYKGTSHDKAARKEIAARWLA